MFTLEVNQAEYGIKTHGVNEASNNYYAVHGWSEFHIVDRNYFPHKMRNSSLAKVVEYRNSGKFQIFVAILKLET